MHYNQNGFTLIESLIVLSIFLIISSITVFSIKPQYQIATTKSFISQLKADLFYGQQYAIANQTEVSVIFIENEHTYVIAAGVNSIVERNYSPRVTVGQGTIPLYFKYNRNGNVDRFGTIFIRTPQEDYKLTLLIGKGRFYVLEE
ncbi:type II secretion system protein [Bacillus sp. EB106-08-02-XG196]|uniref:competence type IV pilus minor pilin ComGD n=1 Tax=Bacillus sp. EB106-08-02-XG196 TaxID=2737049 RepID=UPI0015C43B97|nr:competence type IV pilus minor pilin ComGD [Bacillus sp. EB106-08-02-XG196]NWQ40009.1 type II secretion system protein [Bacillus sp. EB106-08-02-XG196]